MTGLPVGSTPMVQIVFPFDLLDVARNAGDGAAGSDARHENVDLAFGIVPDFGTGGFDVNCGIGRIIELAGHHVTVGVRGQDFLRFGDGAGHALASLP